MSSRFSCTAISTTHLVLSSSELLEKLAALIPPPRLNLARYHGVFAPAQGCGWLAAGETHHAADRAQLLSLVFQM